MKYLLIILAFISAAFFPSAIYPERCGLPIAMSMKAIADTKFLVRVIEEYRKENNSLPKRLVDLTPKYAEKIPDDAWGREYLYEVINESNFNLYSLGSDGIKGGDGGASDVDASTDSKDLIERIQNPIWGCNT